MVVAGSSGGGGGSSRLVRGHDAAATALWHRSGPPDGVISAITLAPVTPGLLYAVANGGIWRSTDDGAHWLKAKAGVRCRCGRSRLRRY